MTAEVLQNIANSDLDMSREEFRSWAKSAVSLIDGIFSSYHQDSLSFPARDYAREAELALKPSLISQADTDRLCDEFETVFEYAKHGEARIGGELVEIHEIESILERFLGLGGLTWVRQSPYTKSSKKRSLGWDQGLCVLIGKHAAARHELDFGEFLTLSQIALLANVDERTVQNATLDKRPQSRLILADSEGPMSSKFVYSPNAEKWLKGRRKFKKTKTITDEIAEDSVVGEAPTELFQIQHFVPVASDATFFHPENCNSPGGFYSVGEKGREEKFDSYLEALVELQKMPVPRWRRPNANQHFGIVKGVSWERKSAEELGLENLVTGEENLARFLEED